MSFPAYLKGYSITGIGWPWTSAGPKFVNDIEWVNGALESILFTMIRQRKMNPLFGAALLQVVFENQGIVFESLAKMVIERAIATYLPFIDILDIKIEYKNEEKEGKVVIIVEYKFNGKKGSWFGEYGEL